ncbi:MAG: glycine--tRNA ligase subunit beta [Thermodesulfovibrio sp.]|nr:glycine--tRNA ligase subunit beta [Thermodesulfovibrio sp.]
MTADTLSQGLPLLLELGTEEIPSRFLPGALKDLERIASMVFSDARIAHEGLRACATPRRLSLIIQGVAAMQQDNTREVFGPAKKAAFDEAGNPTRAAIGFAQSAGVSPADLVIKKKGAADYVVAVVYEKGVETVGVLPEMLRKIVLSLRFPKSMRWGNGDFAFVRPIHWLVSIYGTQVIPLDIEGIKATGMTRGHRFLSPGSFQVKDISLYMNLLENSFVILDQEKRKQIIRDGIVAIATKSGGHPVMDEELLELVNFLVEYPTPVLCSFNAEYLKLPKELLITVMKDHQKYFAIEDDNGSLINKFVVISNTRAENNENVRIGAERVIKARFDDAKFYFYDDLKKKLEERVEDLRKVTFHDRLGSTFAKTERIVSIAKGLAAAVNPALAGPVARAALLSKTDLISGVVREFPELQGIMGRYYAMNDREADETAAALEEQYLPKAYGGLLPASDVGALVSMADKLDSIAAFFAIGQVPSGSEDPFALRRQAMGIVAILLDRGYGVTVREIFDTALGCLGDIRIKEGTAGNIGSFMEQRVEFIFSTLGYEQDLVKAVLSLSLTYPLKTISGRLDALRLFRSEDIYPSFLMAIKRVNNIIPKTPLPDFEAALLVQDEEKALYAAFQRLRGQVAVLVHEKKFAEGLKAFGEITSPVNNFFDKVLVMDKDESVKNNRLALLRDIWSAAVTLADFSKLPSAS